jgi:hypothetical protein
LPKSIAATHYYVSRSYLEKGENDKALDHATKSISTGQASGKMKDKYFIAQAKAYSAMGKKTEAIASYELVQEGKYKEQAQYQINQLKG